MDRINKWRSTPELKETSWYNHPHEDLLPSKLYRERFAVEHTPIGHLAVELRYIEYDNKQSFRELIVHGLLISMKCFEDGTIELETKPSVPYIGEKYKEKSEEILKNLKNNGYKWTYPYGFVI